MPVDHPLLLIVAIILSLPCLPAIGRTFFTNYDEFLSDSGLADPTERLGFFIDAFRLMNSYGWTSSRGVFLNIIWFLVIVAALITGLY